MDAKEMNRILIDVGKDFFNNQLFDIIKIFAPWFIFIFLLKLATSWAKKYKKENVKRKHSKNNDLLSKNGKFNLNNLESGFHFEEYMVDLLTKLNYKNVRLLPEAGDYGADILAELNGVVHAIQCKYYSNHVGVKAVQEIMGGKEHYKAHVAIVATNNKFTNNAINLAKSNNIILWDKNDLQKMISKVKN